MLTPEQFQDQAFPYLYDLLDEPERQAFEAALKVSQEERASLAIAREKQGLLAIAVKGHFPEVSFLPPVTVAKSSVPAERTVLTRAWQKPRGRWLPWVVAASLLVIGLGGGGYL